MELCRVWHVLQRLQSGPIFWRVGKPRQKLWCRSYNTQRKQVTSGKKREGTCYFLTQLRGTCICGLQHMKALVCKICPFKIFLDPKFGNPNEAHYRYRDRNFFVNVDPPCTRLSWGKPTPEFKYRKLLEFIDVAVGIRRKQLYSISKIQFRPNPYIFRGINLI